MESQLEPTLYDTIAPSDVVIYDKHIDADVRAAGYNIGDLLNMPYLAGQWEQCPHASQEMLDRMNLVGAAYENSILRKYTTQRNAGEKVPDIERIKACVGWFASENAGVLAGILGVVRDPGCVCVHVRSGDLDTEQAHIDRIARVSRLYARVIILAGVHLDERCRSHAAKIQNFVSTINTILRLNTNIRVHLAPPDVHLAVMMHAANLMVHKTGFSRLGAIVATGRVISGEPNGGT